MHSSLKKSFTLMLCLTLFPLQVMSQEDKSDFSAAHFILFFGTVFSREDRDPADHKCCTKPPPESAKVEINDGNISIVDESNDVPWFNFTAPIADDGTFEGENTATVAGNADVRNTFTGMITDENSLSLDVVIGAGGELFGETLEYDFIFDLEPFSVPVPVEPVPEAAKVNTIGGAKRNADFGLGVYSDEGTPTFGNAFSSGDFVTIYGQVMPDAVDVGKPGELFAAILSVVGGVPNFSYINEGGDFAVWDLTLSGLGPIMMTSSLETVHEIKLFEGALQPGVHKITFAYSAEEGPLVYMKPVTVVVSEE